MDNQYSQTYEIQLPIIFYPLSMLQQHQYLRSNLQLTLPPLPLLSLAHTTLKLRYAHFVPMPTSTNSKERQVKVIVTVLSITRR